MGNVLGVGNRPRQGRAVLEILALLYVLRRLGAGSAAADLRQIGAEACSQSDGAVSPANGVHNNSRRPSLASVSSSSGSTLATSDGDAIPATSGSLRADTILARWNAWLRRFNPLQVVLSVLIAVHLWNNASLLLGLNAPHYSMTQEPDMHYTKNFAKIRWLLTSLDAAVLSTLKVRITPLRHLLTVVLSLWYVVQPRRAENKVDAFRRSMTHQAIRACWEKGTTPMLSAVDRLLRKRCVIDLELLEIPSPDGHQIECRLFYNKPREQLAQEKVLLLDFPGGGFIAMSPQHHADYLSGWAIQLGVPVLSVNYRKAPEFPFPCGFEDAWYVYKSIVDSNGGVLGINSGATRSSDPIRIAVAGDSAGGNLTAACTIKAITSGVRVPDGVVMIYPVLDLGSTNFWRESSLPPPDHIVTARPSTRRSTMRVGQSARQLQLQAEPPQSHRPDSPQHCESDEPGSTPPAPSITPAATAATTGIAVVPSSASARPERTACDVYGAPQLSSRALYAQDGVLPLKYMQLIADCYFRHGGDPVNNPLISPSAASADVLAQFPPIFAHVGSVDPLVDDVLRFGARVVAARPGASVQVAVIPRVSHAYMHIVKFLPEAAVAVDLTAAWIAQTLRVPCAAAGPELDARVRAAKIQITDLRDYELHQPGSKAKIEAESKAAAAVGASANVDGSCAPPIVSKL